MSHLWQRHRKESRAVFCWLRKQIPISPCNRSSTFAVILFVICFFCFRPCTSNNNITPQPNLQHHIWTWMQFPFYLRWRHLDWLHHCCGAIWWSPALVRDTNGCRWLSNPQRRWFFYHLGLLPFFLPIIRWWQILKQRHKKFQEEWVNVHIFKFSVFNINNVYMGQILQDGENAWFTSIFFKSRGFVWPKFG